MSEGRLPSSNRAKSGAFAKQEVDVTPVRSAARKLADLFGEEYVFEGADNLAQRGNYADGQAHYINAVSVVLRAIREPSERAIKEGSSRFDTIGPQTREAVIEAWQAMIDAIAEDIPGK